MTTTGGEIVVGNNASEDVGDGSAGDVLVRLVVSRHPYHKEVLFGNEGERTVPQITLHTIGSVTEAELGATLRAALARGVEGVRLSEVTLELVQKGTRLGRISSAWYVVKSSVPFEAFAGFGFIPLEQALVRVLNNKVPDAEVSPLTKCLRLVARAREAARRVHLTVTISPSGSREREESPQQPQGDAGDQADAAGAGSQRKSPSNTIPTGVRPLREDAFSGAATEMRSPLSGGLRAKLDPPPGFIGADPRELPAWFASMNQYWAMLEDPPDELGKVLQATNALKGDAKAWWTHELVAANGAVPVGTWADLQQALLKEYVDDDQNFDARHKLRAVKQVTSVERYICEWRARARYLRSATVDELVSLFLEGLKPRIYQEVRSDAEFMSRDFRFSDDRKDLRFVQRLARAKDSAWSSEHASSSKPRASFSSTNAMPVTKKLFNMQFKRDKQLTQERYKKGQCFICGEPGHKARQCPSRERFMRQQLMDRLLGELLHKRLVSSRSRHEVSHGRALRAGNGQRRIRSVATGMDRRLCRRQMRRAAECVCCGSLPQRFDRRPLE